MIDEAAPLQPVVSVLLVSYRTRELTLACLESLKAATRTPYETIVVDNDSRDGTVESLRESMPEVRVVPSNRNLGFGAAVNLAASRAAGDYLLLLNTDTSVHPGAVDHLLDFARSRPSNGLYGGVTLSPDGSVDPHSVWGAPTPWSTICWGLGLTIVFPCSTVFDPESLGGWNRDSVRDVPVITGALLLVAKEAWVDLDGFDEAFFMYSEDVDLCLRARKRGWRPVMTPDARITHLRGASSTRPDKLVMVMKGRVTLLRKHWPLPLQLLGVALLDVGVALRALGEVAGASGRRPPHRGWSTVWARRAEWRKGWSQVSASKVTADAG